MIIIGNVFLELFVDYNELKDERLARIRKCSHKSLKGMLISVEDVGKRGGGGDERASSRTKVAPIEFLGTRSIVFPAVPPAKYTERMRMTERVVLKAAKLKRQLEAKKSRLQGEERREVENQLKEKKRLIKKQMRFINTECAEGQTKIAPVHISKSLQFYRY